MLASNPNQVHAAFVSTPGDFTSFILFFYHRNCHLISRDFNFLIFSVQIPKNTITAGSFRAKKLHTDIAKVQNDLAEDGSNANTGM